MTPRLRAGRKVRRVLAVLLAATDDCPAWGLSICQDSGLGPGSIYPILERLHEHEWITVRGEFPAGRNYYQLTDHGRAMATAAARKDRP